MIVFIFLLVRTKQKGAEMPLEIFALYPLSPSSCLIPQTPWASHGMAVYSTLNPITRHKAATVYTFTVKSKHHDLKKAKGVQS
jgi:hypothetical protein